MFRCIPAYKLVFRCVPAYKLVFRCIPAFGFSKEICMHGMGHVFWLSVFWFSVFDLVFRFWVFCRCALGKRCLLSKIIYIYIYISINKYIYMCVYLHIYNYIHVIL